MFCPNCGHKIIKDFAKFCDDCGADLSIKLGHKKSIHVQKEFTELDLKEKIDELSYIFAIWVTSFIVASFFLVIFYFKDHNVFLPIAAFVGVCFVWLILLFQLEDLSDVIKISSFKYVYLPLLLPIFGTFYSYFCIVKKINQLQIK